MTQPGLESGLGLEAKISGLGLGLGLEGLGLGLGLGLEGLGRSASALASRVLVSLTSLNPGL